MRSTELRESAIAYQTIVVREVLRFSRIWVQTITPPAISAILYMVIFGGLIGSRIGQMDGHSYMSFIVPGLIMMSVIVNSYSNVASSFFSAKLNHSIEEMLVSPVHNAIIVAGFVSGGVLRGLVVGALVALVSLFFTHLEPVHYTVTILITVATSVMFALAGLINAVYAKTFDAISIVPNFVLTPLTYLGGVFYSIDLLAPFWQKVSMLNPVLYMVNGFRFGILGTSDINIVVAFLVIVTFILVLASIAMHLLNRGIGLKS